MGGSISREGNNKKGLAIGLGVGLGVFAWPFLACLAVNVIPEGTLTTNVLTANEVTIKYSNCIGRGDKFLSPHFRAILSFSRCAHWLSCCAHGGFFVRLGVEEWERWTTWVGFRCGAVASALLRQSRDTAEALSEMFLVAPCALSEGRAHSLGLLQYSQHCHRSLIRARCGWLLLRFYHR